MKKTLFIVALILVLTAVSAFAAAEIKVKDFVGKMGLWDHSFVILDQSDNAIEVPVRVTIETDKPIDIESLPVADEMADSLCIVQIDREGVGTVYLALSPADRGLHYNLNDYTDEMLDEYIKSAAAGSFDEGTYTAEKRVSEGGNTYVCITDAHSQLLSTIYDDFIMEFYLLHNETDAEGNIVMKQLTDEDKAFAVEMFQSVWTESIEYPDYDTVVTVNVDKKWLSDIGLDSFSSLADFLNDASLTVHNEESLGKLSLKSGDNELFNMVVTAKEDGIYFMSNLIGDKALLLSYESLANYAANNTTAPAADESDAADFNYGANTLVAISEIAPTLTSVNEDGSLSMTLSSEAAMQIVNAVADDLTATGSVKNKIQAKMLQALASSMLPEEDVVTYVVSSNDDGSEVTVKSTFNWIDLMDSKLKTVTSEVKVTVSEDSLSANGIVVMPSSSDYLLTLNADTEKAFMEIVYESAKDGNKAPAYSLAFASDRSGDNDANVTVDELAFKVADENGELAPLWILTGMYNVSDDTTLTGSALTWAGYDEPVMTVLHNTKFTEDIDLVMPAEIIDVLNLDEDTASALANDIAANLEQLTSSLEAKN